MAAAQEIKNLNQLAMEMGEAIEGDPLPIYPVAPSGMIDLATAKREYGVNSQAPPRDGWSRGELPVLGKNPGTRRYSFPRL